MRQILERRIQMIQDLSIGVPLKEEVEILSQKYKVGTYAIYKDWKRRDKWINEVVNIKDTETTALELISFLNWLKARANRLVLEADNSNAKIGAIRAATEISMRIFEILQSTGLIRKEPEKLEQQLRIIVEEETIDAGTIAELNRVKVETAPRAAASPQEPSPL